MASGSSVRLHVVQGGRTRSLSATGTARSVTARKARIQGNGAHPPVARVDTVQSGPLPNTQLSGVTGKPGFVVPTVFAPPPHRGDPIAHKKALAVMDALLGLCAADDPNCEDSTPQPPEGLA